MIIAVVFVCKKETLEIFKKVYNIIKNRNRNRNRNWPELSFVAIIDDDLLNHPFKEIDKDIIIKYYPNSNYLYIFDTFFKHFWHFVMYIDLERDLKNIYTEIDFIFQFAKTNSIVSLSNILLFDTTIISEDLLDDLLTQDVNINNYFTKNNVNWIKY